MCTQLAHLPEAAAPARVTARPSGSVAFRNPFMCSSTTALEDGQRRRPGILTHHHVDDVEGEDVNGEQGERQGEHVEVSVVPLAHAVPHPGTVVIKAVCGGEKKRSR